MDTLLTFVVNEVFQFHEHKQQRFKLVMSHIYETTVFWWGDSIRAFAIGIRLVSSAVDLTWQV